MKIKVDYYLEEGGSKKIMHYTFTEAELSEYIVNGVRNGDLPCPMHFSRENVNIDVQIDKVIV